MNRSGVTTNVNVFMRDELRVIGGWSVHGRVEDSGVPGGLILIREKEMKR